MLKTNKSKTLTYRQDEEEIKRDRERERGMVPLYQYLYPQVLK